IGLECRYLTALALPPQSGQIIPHRAVLLRSHRLKNSLLFCVEVDMDTETLASPRGRSGDWRQQITSDRELMLGGQYRQRGGEEVAVDGFRVLFVLAGKRRLRQFIRLCQQLSPCQFVWCADFESLGERGAGSLIWHRGGDDG